MSETGMEIQVIDGPMPTGVSGILYEITLPSGAIVTSPAGFGVPRPEGQTVVTEDGQVLA